MKKIIILVLAFVMMFSTMAQAEKIKLTMFDYLDLTDQVEVKNREEMWDAFSKLHPDIEIEREFGFSEAYHNKLQPMAVAGQIPDIVFLWPGKRTAYVTGRGLIKDLSPWKKGHEAEFAGGALNAQVPNGEIYELPEQMTSTHVMFTKMTIILQFAN